MKKKVKVLQLPNHMFRDSYIMTTEQVKESLGEYDLTAIFYGEGDDEDLCELAFERSNSPFNPELRGMLFGQNRSLSVGDVVCVNDRKYHCSRFGWTQL